MEKGESVVRERERTWKGKKNIKIPKKRKRGKISMR